MKHVLIPTDFTIGSLQAVHAAVAAFPEEQIRISLLHLLEMPNGIGDLLMRAVRKEPTHLATSDFQKACEIILNKYGQRIHKMEAVFRYGSTRAYVQNMLEGLKIDTIVLDPEYKLSLPHSGSIKMVPLLKKSGYPIVEMAPSSKTRSMAHVSFGSLLLKETTSPQPVLSGT